MAHAQRPNFLFRRTRTSPFKSAGASVQSTDGSRGVRIRFSNAGFTTFRGSVRVLAIHSIRQFPLHFPSRASPCAVRFQTHSTTLQSKIWIVVRWIGVFLIIFVELRVVAGRSRTRAGSPQAVSRRPCCVVALRRTVWSEHGMGAAWQV